FDPLPDFSESWYLNRYPDIAAAVERGEIRNGYHHFLTAGVAEHRSASATIDLRYYAGRDEVRTALLHRDAPDAFTHYLTTGRAQGVPGAPPPEELVSEGQAKTLFRRKATALAPLFGRAPLDFSHAGTPALSVERRAAEQRRQGRGL